jgi:hypothetical protein
MSELTDVLRRRYRHTLVEKIEATIESADPEVGDILTDALIQRQQVVIPEAVVRGWQAEQLRVAGLLSARAEDIQSRLRKAGLESYADEVDSLMEQAYDLVLDEDLLW